MISLVRIGGFKRFLDREFRLAPLTLLAGLNGAGKTSVIHSLLLIKEISQQLDYVKLNGPYGIELGTFEDIQNWYKPDDVTFEVVDSDGYQYAWALGGSAGELFARIKSRPSETPSIFSGHGRMFQYICAERIGPRSVLGSSILPPERLDVGYKGEFTGQMIYTLGSSRVDPKRCLPPLADNGVCLLKVETERWMSSITREVQIDTETFTGTSMNSMRFRFDDDWVRPPNTGFGVTYALPIVVAGLSARLAGLLMVENPEAHLHPAGQAQMGCFLATLAAAGVQVVVETHSDHLINGIRRTIGEGGMLEATDAVVHFFPPKEAEIQELRFSNVGGIQDWPKGFMDQYPQDVAAISRLRRRK